MNTKLFLTYFLIVSYCAQTQTSDAPPPYEHVANSVAVAAIYMPPVYGNDAQIEGLPAAPAMERMENQEDAQRIRRLIEDNNKLKAEKQRIQLRNQYLRNMPKTTRSERYRFIDQAEPSGHPICCVCCPCYLIGCTTYVFCHLQPCNDCSDQAGQKKI